MQSCIVFRVWVGRQSKIIRTVPFRKQKHRLPYDFKRQSAIVLFFVFFGFLTLGIRFGTLNRSVRVVRRRVKRAYFQWAVTGVG